VSAIRDGIELAVGYLKAAQSADGLWRDFRTPAGEASEWVTAFVLAMTADLPDMQDVSRDAAARLLRCQRSDGGWGYNPRVPSDADSTAWALVALERETSQRPTSTWRALDFLRRHQDIKSGGFATYTPSSGIAQFIGVQDPLVTAGWCSPHVCVSALAIRAISARLRDPRQSFLSNAAAFVSNERGSGPLWNTYWWKGQAYVTYLCLRALWSVRLLGREEVFDALDTAVSFQQSDGGWQDASTGEPDIFETALWLLALLIYPSERFTDNRLQAARMLLRAQLPDGSWPVLPILQIPPPSSGLEDLPRTEWRRGGTGTGVIVEDHARVFTTAAACRGLRALRDLT